MKFWQFALYAVLFILAGPVVGVMVHGQQGNVFFPGCVQYYSTVYPGSYGGQGYYPYYPNGSNYYGFQPGYAAQKVVAQEIAVAPYIVTVPVDSKAQGIASYGVNHYWSVQEAYQQQQLIRNAVREELKVLMNNPAAPAQSNLRPPATTQPSAGKVSDLGIDTTTPVEIATPLIASMSKTCFKCHGAVDNELKGGLRLLHRQQDGTLKLAQQTPDRKWRIFAEMSTGLMPPAAEQDATKAVPQTEQMAWFRWASGR